MGNRIQFATGDLYFHYINNNIPICHKCAALLDEVSEDDEDIYKCPNCGWSIDPSDYEPPQDGVDNTMEDVLGMPAGCEACGGPFPLCRDSCSLFE